MVVLRAKTRRYTRHAALGTSVVLLLVRLSCNNAFQGATTPPFLSCHHVESSFSSYVGDTFVGTDVIGLAVGRHSMQCINSTTNVEALCNGGGSRRWGCADKLDDGPVREEHDNHGVALSSDMRCSSHRHGGISSSSSSREGFLKTISGLGAGMMAGASGLPQPTYALLEDVKKPGRCPKYEAVERFDVAKYMGIWYELAYHDWTQIEFCGCTRFNMTRTGNQIDDAFTTKCPYQNDEGETYVINMREEVNMATPGSFHEHAFYNTWRNKVVALWRSSDEDGGERYERAIQFQCVEVLGRRAFVGINFLSRAPIVRPQVLRDLFDQARLLGLAPLGGNPTEMVIVPHQGCQYPSSTDSSLHKESLSWGSGWGVNRLALT